MKTKQMHGRWAARGKLLIAAATLTGMAVVGAGTASASPPGNSSSTGLPVTATLGGGSSGAGPNVECSWGFPDLNTAGGTETTQYSQAISANINTAADSLSYTDYTQANGAAGNTHAPAAPSGTPGNTGTAAYAFSYGLDTADGNPVLKSAPCALNATTGEAAQAQGSATSSGGVVTVTPGAGPLFAVSPNPGDSPAPVRIGLWSAVDIEPSVANVNQVSWNVYYPDGKEDTAVAGIPVPQSLCGGFGTGTANAALTSMFTTAGEYNEIGATAITNGTNGIVDKCIQGSKTLYDNAFTISKDEPSGTWYVETVAIYNGNTTDTWWSFTVLPELYLSLDFTSVAFTCTTVNAPCLLSGNDTWSAAGTSTAPAVTELGNEGEQIGLDFSTLTQTVTGSPQTITSFDGKVGYNPSTEGSSEPTFPAGTTYWLPDNTSTPVAAGSPGSGIVCPNDAAKLDLSLEPPASGSFASGSYTGTLTVSARADVNTTYGCPTDNNAPYLVTVGGVSQFQSLGLGDTAPLVRA